ncbi:hypothetical protein [Profundibacter sp.]
MHKNFRDAFIEHLDRTGAKVTDISTATGVNKDSLYALKRGTTMNMNVRDAILVAEFFDKTVEEFMGVERGALRDSLIDQIAQLSDSERQIFEASLKAVLAARDRDGEAKEPDRSAEEDQ